MKFLNKVQADIKDFTDAEARKLLLAVEHWIESKRESAIEVFKELIPKIPMTQRKGGLFYRGFGFDTEHFTEAQEVIRGKGHERGFSSWTSDKTLATDFARAAYSHKDRMRDVTISILAEANIPDLQILLNLEKFCKSKLRVDLAKLGKRKLSTRAVSMCKQEKEVLAAHSALEGAKFTVWVTRALPGGRRPFLIGSNKYQIETKDFLALSKEDFIKLTKTPVEKAS